ncbi:ADP-ribosylglycohydrolase family protein [Marinobacter sp. SS5-14b]|uniref:ADP-ribosylglycohydrolase family protein n=1 Tax=Marinobacter sp. SS5-14b TaxID=3050456 RepID=UPI0026DF4D11|nr:ADP-ribosylglycohydrolase family protein [Marinobacter sp. SS5-14b]
MNLNERATGGLIALACGDALANHVEFSPRGSYQITGMDYRSGPLPTGQWSDDTGLALCLAESFIAESGFNPKDQMLRYEGFYERGEGWPGKYRLAAGNTLAQALKQFKYTDEPFCGSTHPLAAGNGGLMRLLPAVLAAYPDHDRIRQWARESTRTTHGAPECLEASECLALILASLLNGEDKATALQAAKSGTWASPKIRAIAEGQYQSKADALIKAKGYVVDTLEAALWCFAATDTLEVALLKAANLGDDCDTVAAIAGQLAGCHYGKAAIPADWLDKLVNKDRIEWLAQSLIDLNPDTTANPEG